MNFNGYDLKEEIVLALKDLKFEKFTDIQNEVLPLAFNGKSFIGQSKTGSGKTHAFLIPIFNSLDLEDKTVQVIIASPTRELAGQIYKVAKHLASFFNEEIDIRLYTGGTDRLREIEKLNNSQPQIVIGTPGKISDLMIKANALRGYTAKRMVVDEADMAFEIGFMDDLDLIAGRLTDPQIMVFSATVREEIRIFISKYISSKEHIKIEDTKLNVRHILIPIKSRDKYSVLDGLIKNLNPYLAIIFANTKDEAMLIRAHLLKSNIKAALVHGGLTPRERKRVMNEINDLKYQYIIASDIAARGIDITGVSHVINFSLPTNYEFYIHRSGRTGRANMDGICYSLCEFNDEQYLRMLEDRGITFEYLDILDGNFVNYNPNRRSNRVKPLTVGEKKAIKMVKKPKKVTPGYKKKQQAKIKEIAKKINKKEGRKK